MRQVVLRKDSRDKLIEGIDILADAVSSTLGPSGKTVVIHIDQRGIFTTKDGVTVAKSIQSSDPLIDAGIQLIKNASLQMDEDCGDGTTGVTVISRGIVKNFLKSNYNLRKLISEIDQYKSLFFSFLDSQAKFDFDLREIAMVSSNSDKEISDLVVEAFSYCDGDYNAHINIIDANDGKSRVYKEEGYVIDLGLMDPMFANESSTSHFVSENARLVIVDKEVNNKPDFISFLKNNNDKDLIIIAPDFSYEMLDYFKFYNANNAYKIAPIKNHKRILETFHEFEDLSFLSDCSLNQRLNILYTAGEVSRAVLKPGYSVFKFDDSFSEKKDELLESLKDAYQNHSSPFMKEQIQKRITKLKTGIISIYLGAETDIALKEKKDRLVDTINTCRNAYREGVVMGGGYSYILFEIQKQYQYSEKERDLDFNSEIIAASTSEIIRNIIYNNSYDDTKVKEVLEMFIKGSVYDVVNNRYIPISSFKVFDPVYVLKKQFELAASIAITILSTECLIVNEKN